MHRLIVGVTLRQHVPLRARVQNPQHGLQDRTRRYRLASGAPLGDVFLRKVFPNPFPLFVAQLKHDSAL